jgi:hypothetical protein
MGGRVVLLQNPPIFPQSWTFPLHASAKCSQDFNIVVLIDSLATGNPPCHHIPDVEQTISVALNFELVVQPLVAFGQFGGFQCMCCPFVSGSYVTMFYYK